MTTSMCQSMVAAPRNHILDYSSCFTLGIQPAGGTGMPHWQTIQETISSPVEICIAFSLPAVPWERSFLFRLSTSSPKTSSVVCGRGSKGWSYSDGPWVSHAARAGGCWQELDRAVVGQGCGTLTTVSPQQSLSFEIAIVTHK